MSGDNIPIGGGGDTLHKSIAGIASDINSMGALSIAAYNFENKFSAAEVART